MNDYDRLLIFEALTTLVRDLDDRSPILSKLETRVKELSSNESPKTKRSQWQPTIQNWSHEEAMIFLASETCFGHTKKYLASKGVPWPPPSGWKKRLKQALKDHFIPAIDQENEPDYAYLSDELDEESPFKITQEEADQMRQ